MLDDLRFATRILRRFKLYTIAATATLALTIGAATAVFSVIDATLLRPLPFRDPAGLMALGVSVSDQSGDWQPFPLTQIELVGFRDARNGFQSIEALEAQTLSLTGSGEPALVDAGAITSGLFPTLGVAPAVGRLFSAEEERQGAGVAVLSDRLWRERFNGSPSAIGQSITLGGRPYVVVGIMPASLRLLFDQSDVWIPLNPIADASRQYGRMMIAIGRLQPAVSAAQAEAELAAISAVLARDWPISHARTKPLVLPLHESLYGQRAPALWMLGGAVLGLMLLACANVANLTLGHLSMRGSELATRVLVGAARWRILRMLLAQTALLASVGGGLAIAGVAIALPPLINLYNGDGLGVLTLGLDWRVVGVTALMIGGTTVLCTLIPALKIHRAATGGEGPRLAAVRTSAGPWERRIRSGLVMAQMGIAVALLCTSATFLKSLNRVLETPTGFTSDGVLTMQMLLPPAIYPDVAARADVVRRMLERVSAVPGVLAAGTTQSTFLPGQSMFTMMYAEGSTTAEADRVHIRHITPGYFQALDVTVIEGRPIDTRDQLGTPDVCLVSKAFADKYYPNGNALGHRVSRARATPVWLTIVGIVDDVRDNGQVNEPGATLYVPYFQQNTPTARVSLLARTAGDPVAAGRAIQQAIWEVDRNQPIDRVLPLERVLTEGASAERFRTVLVTAFASLGLMLAVVGVYAVAAASVAARTWEASLRLALGARPWRLVAGMVRDVGLQALIGVGAGIVLFLATSRLISGLLFQTSAVDLSIVAGASAAILVLALAAATLQLRRLGRVSPAMGLRGGAGVQKATRVVR